MLVSGHPPISIVMVLCCLVGIVSCAASIRLVDPVDPTRSNSLSGRVEVLHNGDWGTICNHHWDIHDGAVACRMLGYPEVRSVGTVSVGNRGTGQIWLSDLQCSGTEESLADCFSSGWGTNQCSHAEDANVTCYGEAYRARVQLRGGQTPERGFLQMYIQGFWKFVDGAGGTTWSNEMAAYYCGLVGYAAAGNATFHRETAFCDVSSDAVVFVCEGNQTSLAGCSSARRDCDDWSGNFTFLTCGEPQDIPLRLTNGSSGFFELFVYGEWGTVIADFNQRNVSMMVCRQLGYETAVVTDNPFGYKSGTVWLVISCNGNESSIFECPSYGLGITGGHIKNDMISVSCRGSVACPNVITSHGLFTFHGNVTSRLTSGSSVTVSCDEGYSTYLNITSYTCEEEAWHPQTPACEVPCPTISVTPPLSANSTLTSPGNSTLTFTCEVGFVLQGAFTITCAGGTWSAAIPACIASSVACPNVITSHGLFTFHGNVTSKLTSGSSVTVSCDEGYSTYLNITLYTCEEGAWHPQTPACEVPCPTISVTPPLSANSTLTSPGNSTLTFTCEVGFVLQGASTITCAGGAWSAAIPTCIAIMTVCPNLELPVNLVADGVGLQIGTRVSFRCIAGWHVLGATAITCQQDGQWSAPIPACVEEAAATCAAISQDHRDSITYHYNDGTSAATVGTTASLNCSVGYSPVSGAQNLTCSEGGVWQPYPNPKCGPNCDSEEVSGAHLHANSSQVYPGVAVGFSCDADYVLGGAETITCLSAGLWSHPVPTCTQDAMTTDAMPTTDISTTAATTEVVSEGGLTGGQLGGIAGGVVAGMLLTIGITAAVTVFLTRKWYSSKMAYGRITAINME